MGLLKFLFGGSAENTSYEAPMYEVKIKGTIQCNGPKIINKVVVMDQVQMKMFTGSKRYEAIEGWIKANYPAAKPLKSYRGFAVEAKQIKKK